MRKLRPLFAIPILLFTAAVSQAKEWHGIVPLYSTRADVERLFGKPNAKLGRYDIENEEAQITYSSDRCANGWNVPRDTVIQIVVTFHQTVRLSDLQIDLSKYKRDSDPQVRTHTYYTNRKEGIRYVVLEGVGDRNGVILNVYYEPTSEDEHLYCRSGKTYPTEPCPSISVACADKSTFPFTFTVTYSPDREGLTFNWTVSAGAIIDGQGTPKIRATAPAGTKTITATVRIDGFPKDCLNTASCSTEVTMSRTATIRRSKKCPGASTRRTLR